MKKKWGLEVGGWKCIKEEEDKFEISKFYLFILSFLLKSYNYRIYVTIWFNNWKKKKESPIIIVCHIIILVNRMLTDKSQMNLNI